MMSEETPESLIPYDEIVQEALREVVGRVLHEVEKSGGLPGGHHFYITFKTRMPGVEIPKHLVERFPDEMTIVIQHRFWDLKVEDDSFTVGLSFGGVPATLHVPFAAVTQFHDPAVEFALIVPFLITLPLVFVVGALVILAVGVLASRYGAEYKEYA